MTIRQIAIASRFCYKRWITHWRCYQSYLSTVRDIPTQSLFNPNLLQKVKLSHRLIGAKIK